MDLIKEAQDLFIAEQNETYEHITVPDLEHITEQFMKKILLQHELRTEILEKRDRLTLEEATPIVLSILRKYQWKAGGYSIEDMEWCIHDHLSARYELTPDQLVYENTIDANNAYSNETFNFLESIVRILNTMSGNISAKHSIYDSDSKHIKYVVIKITNSTSS